MSTIVAVSTPPGSGGIAVVRLSGPDALKIADLAWKGAKLSSVVSHTAHLGQILDSDGSALDSAVATVFVGPNSFTGEDTVEFSVHGSRWIQRHVVDRLVQLGATPAGPGEFTQRAFINGRLDLAQAEAVADIIASSSRAAHRLAMQQLNGSFSRRLNQLRESLVELASLLELELDFSEEEVEFADREKLRRITDETLALIDRLASTYESGRAFKEGVPVAIAGAPNAGKSTLLNCLLGDDKAIVSDIPGTTRDLIEDTREINGILFRFIDTAGLRETDDTVESIGIERARRAIGKSAITLWLIDPTQPLDAQLTELDAYRATLRTGRSKLITVKTKSDLTAPTPGNFRGAKAEVKSGSNESEAEVKSGSSGYEINISAKSGAGLPELEQNLVTLATADHDPQAELIITNARHHAALTAGAEALRRAKAAIAANLPADLTAQDVREALHHLGQVTGAITPDHLLSTIFTHFCIGK